MDAARRVTGFSIGLTRGALAGLALALLALSTCAGAAPPGGRPEFPLVTCPLGAQGEPTAPPGYSLVDPGVIAFGSDMAWHDVSGGDTACGSQAVRGAEPVIAFASLGGEDRIAWVATLARPGRPTTPDPVLPTMTLFRLDPGGRVLIATQTQETFSEYSMRGNYGHDAQPGSYLMRIVSGSGDLLAEGRFEINE